MKVIFALCLFSATLCAFADGGEIRLHKQAGPFVVTLFTMPEPLSEGPADFSVAVERQGSLGLLQDAQITLVLSQLNMPSGDTLVLPATHRAATSRFLQAANFRLPHPGIWNLRVIVSHGSEAGECSGLVDVLPSTTLNSQIFWQIAAVPFVVFLFFLHHRRKTHLYKNRG